jgi:molybdopterin converting factor subunit 1
MAVTIRVLFFASARELAGTSKAEVKLSGDSPHTTKELREVLAQQFPQLADDAPSVTLALNQEYIDGEVELADNDEVALIPAISGG